MANGKQREVEIVWFKRDLRLHDHEPLSRAIESGRPIIPLYLAEPEVLRGDDYSRRHWLFTAECLTELRAGLAALGQPLIVRQASAIDALEELRKKFTICTIWSHEETGNAITYARDKKVAAWCETHRIIWHEIPQFGVIRRLKTRDGWSRRWDRRMSEELFSIPKIRLTQIKNVEHGVVPTADDLGLPPDEISYRQKGGEYLAQLTLDSFLEERGQNYQSDMSNPRRDSGETGCSRLSPYLAYGAISMKTVTQATWQRQRELKEQANDGVNLGKWRPSMKSFTGRLHWHCHFMQKLEDDPRIEFENFVRAYDGMRENDWSEEKFEAYKRGLTGYPFVDACMRYLQATGWINFRMRAMLVSFSSYTLWLQWRQPALYIARLFTDYEPGIHYSQFQMQSGTTGINTLRIYSPVKQSKDQDPRGDFIRRWVPELEPLSEKQIHEPWKITQAEQKTLGVILGKDYPERVVDHDAAKKEAASKVYAVRKRAETREEANAVMQKHGSRKGSAQPSPKRRRSAREEKPKAEQGELSL